MRIAVACLLIAAATGTAASAGRCLDLGELFQALAEQDVVPILAVEGAALEQPLIDRRRQAVLDRPPRDAEIVANQLA